MPNRSPIPTLSFVLAAALVLGACAKEPAVSTDSATGAVGATATSPTARLDSANAASSPMMRGDDDMRTGGMPSGTPGSMPGNANANNQAVAPHTMPADPGARMQGADTAMAMMDDGMQMMSGGMDMMQKGKQMMMMMEKDEPCVGKCKADMDAGMSMMDDGMEMMDKGKSAMSKGKSMVKQKAMGAPKMKRDM